MTLIASTQAAHAAEPAGTISPFSCGPSTAEVVEESSNYVEIGKSHKAIRLVNKAGADAGFVITDLPEKNVLADSKYIQNSSDPREDNSLRITMKGTDTDAIKDVVVRMCFKPQLGLPDLISVDVPLSKFRPGAYRAYVEFYARRSVLFGNRPGVPDLRKLSVILTKPGEVTLGGINWGVEPSGYFFEPKTIATSNAGCDAGRPCVAPVKALVKSKIDQVRSKIPTRPNIPTR